MEQDIRAMAVYGGATLGVSYLWFNSPSFMGIEAFPILLAVDGIALLTLKKMCHEKKYKLASVAMGILGVSYLALGVANLTKNFKNIRQWDRSRVVIEMPFLVQSFFFSVGVFISGREMLRLSYRLFGAEGVHRQQCIGNRIAKYDIWAIESLINASYNSSNLIDLVDFLNLLSPDQRMTYVSLSLASGNYDKDQIGNFIVRVSENELSLSWFITELDSFGGGDIAKKVFEESREKQAIIESFNSNTFESTLEKIENAFDKEKWRQLYQEYQKLIDATHSLKALADRLAGVPWNNNKPPYIDEWERRSKAGKEKWNIASNFCKDETKDVKARLGKLGSNLLESDSQEDNEEDSGVLLSAFMRQDNLIQWQEALEIKEYKDVPGRLKELGCPTLGDLRRRNIWNDQILTPKRDKEKEDSIIEAFKRYTKERRSSWEGMLSLTKKACKSLSSKMVNGAFNTAYLVVWGNVRFRAASEAPLSFFLGFYLGVFDFKAWFKEMVDLRNVRQGMRGTGLINLLVRELTVTLEEVNNQSTSLGGLNLSDRFLRFSQESIASRSVIIGSEGTLISVCDWGHVNLNTGLEITPGHFVLGYDCSRTVWATSYGLYKRIRTWNR